MGAIIGKKGFEVLDKLLEDNDVKTKLQTIAVQCSAGSRWGYIKHKYLWWLPFDMRSYQEKDKELLGIVNSAILDFKKPEDCYEFTDDNIDTLVSYIADYGRKDNTLEKMLKLILPDSKNPVGQPGLIRDGLRLILLVIAVTFIVLSLGAFPPLAFIPILAFVLLFMAKMLAAMAAYGVFYGLAKVYTSSVENSDDSLINQRFGALHPRQLRETATPIQNTTPELLNTGPLARVVGSDPPSPSPRPPAPDSGSSTLAGSVSQSGPPLSTPRTP